MEKVASFPKMHPRRTRNRPLLILKKSGYQLFCNTGSPGFLRPSLFSIDHVTMWADAVSCLVIPDKLAITIMIGTKQAIFCCFMVQFWSELTQHPNPVLLVDIHAPSHWSPQDFLDVFDLDLRHHNTISVIRSYYLKGVPCFSTTINTIHHRFM
jgi:hypothetical protein